MLFIPGLVVEHLAEVPVGGMQQTESIFLFGGDDRIHIHGFIHLK